jgi:hypothetical protein
MRLFRYAVLAALLAIPVLVASAPATYAAGSAGASTRAFATPAEATPRARVTFTVDCGPAPNAGGADATLFGTPLGLPAQIPMSPTSSASFDFSIAVDLPGDIRPGTYTPSIDCPGGQSTTAALRVIAFPSGGVATGDGTTSTTSNGVLAVTGLVLIGMGAIAASFALRRRRFSQRRPIQRRPIQRRPIQRRPSQRRPSQRRPSQRS